MSTSARETTRRKRTDWEVGAWYINPMMHERGRTKALYVRIGAFDTEKYDACTYFEFDGYITEDGRESTFPLTQSNSAYERDMEKIKDIETIRTQIIQTRKRTRYGL